jgi:16S rRNA (cytidine1402-2'-O)-methyltransferase
MRNQSTAAGTLYLFPNFIADGKGAASLPQENTELLKKLPLIVSENPKKARIMMKACGYLPPYEDVSFMILDKRSTHEEAMEVIRLIQSGNDAGIITDSGMPGIADPGALLVKIAHALSIRVVPLSGPSSVFMALSASGLNGQQFRFHGYLAVNKNECIKALKGLEKTSEQSGGETQIFIETPYRNQAMLENLFSACRADTYLCIAADVSGKDEFISTMTIADWRLKKIPDIQNKPTVFLLSS